MSIIGSIKNLNLIREVRARLADQSEAFNSSVKINRKVFSWKCLCFSERRRK